MLSLAGGRGYLGTELGLQISISKIRREENNIPQFAIQQFLRGLLLRLAHNIRCVII